MNRLYTLALLLTLGAGVGCQPKAQVTACVVDDDGLPVTGAVVAMVGYSQLAKGKTDESGKFTGTLRSEYGTVDFVVEKQGYHTINRYIYEFKRDLVDGRWQPWNPTVELQLRKKGKPVPMFVKRVQADMPVLGQPVSYDLLKGDWVKPYGQGEVADFIFVPERVVGQSNRAASRLRLTFSNPSDGMIVVRQHWRNNYGLQLPATAPEAGYREKWEWRIAVPATQPAEGWNVENAYDQDANYYFRIRTRSGTEGEVSGGLYGKIYKGIGFVIGENEPHAKIELQYYLNPDGTRNTEWDGSNLCRNPGLIGFLP